MLMCQKGKSFLEKIFKIQLTYQSKNVLHNFSILSSVERIIFLCNFCLIIFYIIYLQVCNICSCISCLRNKMVQWFQLVLQWDPHKRGKMVDKFGTSHLAVFTMLQNALLNKVCIKAKHILLLFRFIFVI